jgi:hypothetical protein
MIRAAMQAIRRMLRSLQLGFVPFLALLLWYSWCPNNRLIQIVAACVLAGAAIAAAVRSLRKSQERAVALGWAGLVIVLSIIRATDDLPDVRMEYIWTLLGVAVFSGGVLIVGLVRAAARVEPAIGRSGGPIRGTCRLAYRLVFPAWLSMPFVWLTLNQFRRLTYNGDHPNETHYYIIRVEDYISQAMLILFAGSLIAGLYWLIRWNVRNRGVRTSTSV